MGTLPRDVLKWLQSLDLSYPTKNPRRDFANGYLIAEMFSWYFPQDIQMHSFNNGTAIEIKMANWSILQRFFQRQRFNFPQSEIDGTIHCKPKAASLLIQRMYCALTNKIIPALSDEEFIFSDRQYQEELPLHARSTASQAVKNNIANSELISNPDYNLGQEKAKNIIKLHVEHRHEDRRRDPKRFGIKPSLCQRSARRPPRENTSNEIGNGNILQIDSTRTDEAVHTTENEEQLRQINVHQSGVVYQERPHLSLTPIHLKTTY